MYFIWIMDIYLFVLRPLLILFEQTCWLNSVNNYIYKTNFIYKTDCLLKPVLLQTLHKQIYDK